MKVQVYKIHSDFFYVKNSKQETFVCKLRDVLKKQKIDIKVGDFVELTEDCNFIDKLYERKNTLLRPKVSNIDLMLVVCALAEPKLDLIQLNRYLIYLKYHNIPATICFNKEDLIKIDSDEIVQIKELYQNLGYKVLFISAKEKINLEALKNHVKGKTIALCGMSGVGKTTLLNSILLNDVLKTGEVSKKTLRGTHTTRHSEIIYFDNFKIMDTPGFSCLKFDFLLPDELIKLFDDIAFFANVCKYSNCYHNDLNNLSCGVIQNIDKINRDRFESYLCFLNESLDYKKIISKRSIKNESANKNVGSKMMTKISKRKREASRRKSKQSIGEE